MREVRAISAFEGGKPSVYAEEQFALWVRGEISVDEMCARVIRHASRPA